MFKKVMFFAFCIAVGGFAIYKIANNVISDEVDNANFRAVELYANAIKLSTVNINNVMNQLEVQQPMQVFIEKQATQTEITTVKNQVQG